MCDREPVNRQPLRLAIMEAEKILSSAGVSSPRVDAELIAAHVLGVERGKLMLVPLVDRQVIEAIGQLVNQRAKRIPLQHLIGWAAMGSVTVSVGPGVFVPRPETELLLEWGLGVLKDVPSPVIVDLCTGSGALALAFAASRPDAEVHGVEVDSQALAWARRNSDLRVAAGDRPVVLHAGDVADPGLLVDLEGRVDLLVCNPPYVPVGTVVPPEVGEHDPFAAVFGGPDGLVVVRHVVRCAARLLKVGGWFAMEHDDSQGESVPELLGTRRVLDEVAEHEDLSGRPRFVTARHT